MWPLYVLLSKFSRTGEERAQGSGRDHLSWIEYFLYKRSAGTNKCPNTVLSCSSFCEVPHLNQLHTWDCGLACVLMVLRTLGIKDCDMQELEELCCTTSHSWLEDICISDFCNDHPGYSGEKHLLVVYAFRVFVSAFPIE
ncbi:hypothetical protein RND71_030702 [Anisodus tanguticus]|uniref:Uncharacterized protein n=1 Tax=Anisodus tanguticus TaxID=243964 RepID=A0AAE1RFQ3_9SOLA|nr:hypothetical protein RND71_030702 [Anisodus tanguticus]